MDFFLNSSTLSLCNEAGGKLTIQYVLGDSPNQHAVAMPAFLREQGKHNWYSHLWRNGLVRDMSHWPC